jgi:hypothetical protein
MKYTTDYFVESCTSALHITCPLLDAFFVRLVLLLVDAVSHATQNGAGLSDCRMLSIIRSISDQILLLLTVNRFVAFPLSAKSSLSYSSRLEAYLS